VSSAPGGRSAEEKEQKKTRMRGVTDAPGRIRSSLRCGAVLLGLGVYSAVAWAASDPADGTRNQIHEVLAVIEAATPNPVTPEAVAETFAFRTTATDVQRELMEQALVGSAVEWDLLVYDIAYADGMYELTSKRIPIHSEEALPLVHVLARIYARGAEDEAFLRSVRTDEPIRIRGVVQDVFFRTRVVIEPAVVVGDGQ